MSGWGSFKDTCGYPIDEYLTLADIEVGGDVRSRIRQQGSNGHGEEVGSGRELILRCIWTGEDDKVPLGHPPAGRHPNTCEG